MLAEKRKRDQVEGQVLDQTNHSCNCIAQGEEEEGESKASFMEIVWAGLHLEDIPKKSYPLLGLLLDAGSRLSTCQEWREEKLTVIRRCAHGEVQ